MPLNFNKQTGDTFTASELDQLEAAVNANEANLGAQGKIVLASHVQLSHTGTTTQTEVFAGTIPGGSLGPNGVLQVLLIMTSTNNANIKRCRVKLNGVTVGQRNHGSNTVASRNLFHVVNRNSEAAQVAAGVSSSMSYSFSSSTSAVSTFTINTAADVAVSVTIENDVTTDVTTIEAISFIAFKKS